MHEIFNIGEIAEFFQIPKSKLRYWDKEGLIKLSRNINNDYREYSFKAITDIVNILLYRRLNISIKELKTLPDKTLDDLAKILHKADTEINEQIQELKTTQKRIAAMQAALAKINEYRQQPYVIDEFDFNRVVEFKRGNHKHLQLCIESTGNFVIFLSAAQNKPHINGVICDTPDADENIIWRNTQKRCLKCIVKLSNDTPHEFDNADMLELYEYLAKHNYKYGAIIARFLISEFGHRPANYHEVYVELE